MRRSTAQRLGKSREPHGSPLRERAARCTELSLLESMWITIDVTAAGRRRSGASSDRLLDVRGWLSLECEVQAPRGPDHESALEGAIRERRGSSSERPRSSGGRTANRRPGVDGPGANLRRRLRLSWPPATVRVGLSSMPPRI